ncbi:alpha/beta hydrolase [Rhodohalobacter sp. 8-1]|uniref:alpha/beta hydrolase n=1 Tax=Rhodohalobacter sp. 8-1 TaxID=3131972 RepID=UPI0030EE87D9
MKIKETVTAASDGKKLKTRIWLPDGDPDATLLIVHGIGEHSGRYSEFARFMTDKNFVVFGYDHRGHGYTDPIDKGFVPSDDAYHLLVNDLGLMRDRIRKEYPELPLFLFGHSMGSFLTLRHLQLSTERRAPSAVIYSGSSGAVSPLLPFGILFSGVLSTIAGDAYKSEFLRNMAFKPYNNAFKPNRTRHDWISRDTDAVDRYVADPNCGFTPSVSFLNHFFKGLRKTQNHQPFSGPHTYPVLIIAGSEDPLSNSVDGIAKLEDKLSSSGISHIDSFVYDGGRHEMLSELNRDEVMDDIGNWIEKTLAAREDIAESEKR